MKSSFLITACCIFFLSICTSCFHSHNNGDNTNVSISESDDEYKMSAYFNEDKTHKIHDYMNGYLGDRNNFSFSNTVMDATLTLDDRTTFYIKTSPGDLEIKLNRDHNSAESYARVKKMCEGIKDIIAKD